MPADRLITVPPDVGDGWTQTTITFPCWASAEAVATAHLGPLLRDRTDAADWWFVRKRPCWRLRYRPARPDTDRRVADALDTLTATGILQGWNPAVYEPEQVAFGGPAAMATAHRLFHHDSRAVLDHMHQPTAGLPGRRERTVLASTVLLRAAGLDWYEQGDVWATLALHRPARTSAAPVAATAAPAMRHLLTLDMDRPDTAASLERLGHWIAGFDTTGRVLADLARAGRLRRGLRAVLTHHVIFHWNRHGLPYADQRALAVLARDAILGPVPAAVPETSRCRA